MDIYPFVLISICSIGKKIMKCVIYKVNFVHVSIALLNHLLAWNKNIGMMSLHKK